MIEIKSWKTGEVLKTVDADTLRGANLSSADTVFKDEIGRTVHIGSDYPPDLTFAKLNRADLDYANLTAARLVGAQLSGANLFRSGLTQADLSRADLSGASLVGADLSRTKLCRANLTGTLLVDARLTGTNLGDTDLSNATLGRTILDFCDNLHEAKGLENLVHAGPSALDAHTLRASVTKLPHVFLKGVGYKDEEIEALIELYTTKVIEFYSCFIAHSKADGTFADRLRTDLMAKNITCYHYAYDMRGGKLWREQINRAVKVHDKLLVVCSREALLSENVVEEIITAIEEEDGNGIQKLFPIRLDEYILQEEIAQFSHENFFKGKWRMDWVPRVRAYHISDFRKWKRHDKYVKELQRLLDDLRKAQVQI
jgi:uncharacterized protein YjbI with pentapeptide repeats